MERVHFKTSVKVYSWDAFRSCAMEMGLPEACDAAKADVVLWASIAPTNPPAKHGYRVRKAWAVARGNSKDHFQVSVIAEIHDHEALLAEAANRHAGTLDFWKTEPRFEWLKKEPCEALYEILMVHNRPRQSDHGLEYSVRGFDLIEATHYEKTEHGYAKRSQTRPR